MTSSANNLGLQKIVSGIDVNAPDEEIDQSSGDYANALYRIVAISRRGSPTSWAGMDPMADFAGNSGTKQDNLTTSSTSGAGLSCGFAYKGSANGLWLQQPAGRRLRQDLHRLHWQQPPGPASARAWCFRPRRDHAYPVQVLVCA
ncbi:hypothetical protein ACTMU2_22440 [Cupriavidus basilensis]